MTVSIKRLFNRSPRRVERDLKDLLNAARLDLVMVHDTVSDIVTKLNADSGVTDVDYEAPPALNLVE